MARKKEEEIKEIKAPVSPVSPLFSNLVWVLSHPDFVLLDFGFVAPGYTEPYEVEDTQVARICITWDSAEQLLGRLGEMVSEHKKQSKRRSKVKS
jgi:hypothetical protein